MKISAFSWLLLGWLLMGLALALEKVIALPVLFLVVWLYVSAQTIFRWALVQAIGASLLLAATFGISWAWSFLIVWLGYLVANWHRSTPALHWWRVWGWAMGGAWLVGGLAMLNHEVQFSGWVWLWPVIWSVGFAVLKWKRHL